MYCPKTIYTSSFSRYQGHCELQRSHEAIRAGPQRWHSDLSQSLCHTIRSGTWLCCVNSIRYVVVLCEFDQVCGCAV
ncbi:hypothetical protein AV530_004742 [Patagioenas fasciata monilis]|uniref:Uncharacterized protein n=1 Tax=Patagioenas fasciata monilis TaxID=372326 RepID=A0A1V4K4Q9_PATFA|nr:hypothetical protein AV530_004742 [Patagioenas fasciata monilis]